MTRPRKSTRRKPTKPKMIVWKDIFSELFTLGVSWTPPSHVQVRRTAMGATFVAVFHDDAGRPFRLTTRIEIDDANGDMFLVDQKLMIAARVRGRTPILTSSQKTSDQTPQAKKGGQPGNMTGEFKEGVQVVDQAHSQLHLKEKMDAEATPKSATPTCCQVRPAQQGAVA